MLLEKETLSLPDIVDTLGQRPFPLKKNLLDYLHELRGREADTPAEEAQPQEDNRAFDSEASDAEDEPKEKEEEAKTKDEAPTEGKK